MDEIAIRCGNLEDRGGISRILGLNSMPGRDVLEKAFIVAEERGEILAVGSYLTVRERLVLGPLAVDPWVGERRFSVALYSGAGKLAREMGLRGVWTKRDEHREYLFEAGYRRHVGGWRLDTTRPFGNYERLPERGWRRVLSLWSDVHIPFFRAFGFSSETSAVNAAWPEAKAAAHRMDVHGDGGDEAAGRDRGEGEDASRSENAGGPHYRPLA